MKTIRTSTFDFSEIIANDFLYIDKTAYLWKLIHGGKDEYFLSRPRRFGKSLLVSTLKAIFQGRRELFHGLAIERMDYNWREYPILHLDFSNIALGEPQNLRDFLAAALMKWADMYQIELRGVGLSLQFENLIEDIASAKDTQVVVLIDEYDKPMLGNILNSKREEFLGILKSFYSCIKKCEGRIRFAFITGVSKFAHVSLFSDLNNLTDLTLQADYAGMLGFTADEIRANFADRIPLAAQANGLTEEALLERLLLWYDGYRFSCGETHVCNPVSIAKFFSEGFRFANYWAITGMPTFLLELAKNTRFNFEQALTQPVSELAFGAYELDNLDPMGLLWQTGYLTIKEVIPGPLGGSMYRLGFPDYEVEQSFNTQLLAHYSGFKESAMSGVVFQLLTQIHQNRIEEFMKTLQSYFAAIPYDIRGGDERYYQTIFFITFLLLNGAVEAEARTSDGRIDAVVATAERVFIFEFKLDQPDPMALEQIEDKQYYLKYRLSGKPITLVGASFDQTKGRLAEWRCTDMS